MQTSEEWEEEGEEEDGEEYECSEQGIKVIRLTGANCVNCKVQTRRPFSWLLAFGFSTWQVGFWIWIWIWMLRPEWSDRCLERARKKGRLTPGGAECWKLYPFLSLTENKWLPLVQLEESAAIVLLLLLLLAFGLVLLVLVREKKHPTLCFSLCNNCLSVVKY